MALRKISIKEVARLAGVSKTTVSHALSGKRYVSEATKEKIDQVIGQLQYYPNYLARSLVSKKTGIIGLIYPTPLNDSSHRENVEFIFSIANKVSSSGYKFLLMTENYEQENEQVLEIIRSGHVDGLILMDIRLNDERVELLSREKFPFVMIGRNENPADLNYVDIDAVNGVHQAAEYLISLGHKDILFLGIAPENFGFTNRGITGYKLALKEAGIELNKELLQFTPSDEAEACLIMRNLLKERKFTACIAGGDMIALGILKALKMESIQVPEEISVVSFGNSQICTMTNPLITAVSMQYKQMSDLAVEMLVKSLNEEAIGNNHIVLKSELIIRESAGTVFPG